MYRTRARGRAVWRLAIVAIAALVDFHVVTKGYTPWEMSDANRDTVSAYQEQLKTLKEVDPEGKFLCFGATLAIEGTDTPGRNPIAFHCDGYSCCCSNSIRTTRSRIASGYLPPRLVPVIAPILSRVEQLPITGRLSASIPIGSTRGRLYDERASNTGVEPMLSCPCSEFSVSGLPLCDVRC